MSRNSNGWKLVTGAQRVGTPVGAGPSPVTVKLRTVENGESMKPTAPPTSCAPFTRQKYVPFASPLTRASVGVGTSPSKLLKPDAITAAKFELALTSHE